MQSSSSHRIRQSPWIQIHPVLFIFIMNSRFNNRRCISLHQKATWTKVILSRICFLYWSQVISAVTVLTSSSSSIIPSSSSSERGASNSPEILICYGSTGDPTNEFPQGVVGDKSLVTLVIYPDKEISLTSDFGLACSP